MRLEKKGEEEPSPSRQAEKLSFLSSSFVAFTHCIGVIFMILFTSNMESAEEGALRLFKFILGAEAKYHGKTILIVSHGNIMRSLLTYLGWVKYNELPSGSIKNTGYFILQGDGNSFKVTQTSGINRQTGKFRTF